MNMLSTQAVFRVWITDGSAIPFTDVHQLDARHRGPLGLHFPYKGLIDPKVPCGSTVIDATHPDDVFVGEAEWAVLFPEGIDSYINAPGSLDRSTPVVLQGILEGKWLNRLLGTTLWSPASMGNNVIAEGPGIPTTLGAIEAGTVAGEVRVSQAVGTAGAGSDRTQNATLADLRGQNMLGLIHAVLAFCRTSGQRVDAIDLGAIGDHAAIVTEPRRISAAIRLRTLPLPNPMSLLPAHRFELMEKVVREIIAEHKGAPPGLPVTLTTLDGAGRIVGNGAIVWRTARS